MSVRRRHRRRGSRGKERTRAGDFAEIGRPAECRDRQGNSFCTKRMMSYFRLVSQKCHNFKSLNSRCSGTQRARLASTREGGAGRTRAAQPPPRKGTVDWQGCSRRSPRGRCRSLAPEGQRARFRPNHATPCFSWRISPDTFWRGTLFSLRLKTSAPGGSHPFSAPRFRWAPHWRA